MLCSRFSGGVIVAAFVATFAPIGAGAQPSLKIFDSHLHYNQEPSPLYSLDQVLDIFRRNNVAGILSNSRYLEPLGELNIWLGFFLGWGTSGAPEYRKS